MCCLLRRIEHIFWLVSSYIVRCFTRVCKKRVLCWSYGYTKYSCNPRYITEYLIANHSGEYEIYWCFNKDIVIENIPVSVKIVRRRSWKYLWILNTSEFLFSNARINFWESSFLKRKGQKYIMTWHAGMGLKNVEKDAEQMLSIGYLKSAKYDSSICDLMISGSRYMTDTIRRAFWYNGKILECGTPRNDIFFQDHTKLKRQIFDRYGIPSDAKILLYAPTFRVDLSLQYYKFEWKDVLVNLEHKFGSPIYVFLRLHPNFYSNKMSIPDIRLDERIRDLTLYHDMQELLCIADILVTDYSSSMFDFALLKKPCLLYALDYDTYDRGTCFKLSELPFPYATCNDDFMRIIDNFDEQNFQKSLLSFNEEVVGSYEEGCACEEIYLWMKGVE